MFAELSEHESFLIHLTSIFPVCVHAERLPLKAYTVAEGLPNNVINKIVRDSRGFLWFCTSEGLSRFDGYSFTNYGVDLGLPHTTVNDFLELERVRTRIASDLHDDIGSNLSLIAGLSEVLRQQARQVDSQIAERLAVIANASRQLVEAMGDIVWAVNPKRDNVIDLAHRMRRFASDSLTARNIEFHFDAPKPNQNVKINAEVRREVFLVFKEGISNIARHSGCKTARASLKIERGTIILELRDDGHGFDEANLDQGHGLESMRRRAEKLGGKIGVNSQAGAGTTMILTAPTGGRS